MKTNRTLEVSMFSKTSLLLSAALVLPYASGSFARAESPPLRPRVCPAPWHGVSADDTGVRVERTDCDREFYTLLTPHKHQVRAQIRSGYLPENPVVPFRGNVIFYEGLGDSMVNHAPLFTTLTGAGYRVIAFDYMGQGGSTGSMNDTKISEIGKLGERIWQRYARDLVGHPTKNIIGWSTGGLAAYAEARTKGDAMNVVLIAPGLVPNIIIGEQQPARLKFNQITLPTLTTEVYGSATENPHVDPIKPDSPLEIMGFSYDLTATSVLERHHPMPARVNGLVLLSGANDTYVDAAKTFRVLQQQAPHFKVQRYAGALHEIDNEVPSIRQKAHAAILDFLNGLN
jgi:alpha-beta hydrolase superfamily lysophospholipase